MKKVALHNLGCKVNSYETDAMKQMLEESGYEIVDFHEIADIYIINTCSVTNMADRKSRQMIHRAKKQNPDSIVVAAGCYVQTSLEEVQKDVSVDIIVGNNQKKELLHILDEYECNNIQSVIDINDTDIYEELEIEETAEHTRAYIKIQDGCNQFCSYCIIPYARGRVRSRKYENIYREVKKLAEHGYKEIVLTGIHLSSYGIDLEKGSLLSVIKGIHEIDGIARIRLGSLEPRIVTKEFVEEIAKLEKVCPHFHLSLQSGSDATLKRMNRKYTASEFLESCNLLKQYIKDPAITTDVIVGFPGETEEEFKETEEFLKKIKFFEMHVFKFSPRKGTKAEKMPDQISEDVKSKRSHILIELADNMSKEFAEKFIGRTVTVLIEEELEIADVKYYTGHTKEYLKVLILKEENDLEVNQIVAGDILEINKNGIILSNIR